MDFIEVLDQVTDLLRQRGRLTYRTLQRQFDLDDDYLADLKDAILYAHPQVIDDGRGLAWTGEAEAPPESPTPDAERRQLTVMFCDLADSTRLSGQLDPEDLRDVIRAYQSTSAEVIERYDGYIAQHLGDGLMVYFGWPQAHEDDAQRAVHAGLGVVAAMGQLSVRLEKEKGIRLAVRIGIHTGLVVVSEIGKGVSQEHLALGETPNIASRIEGVAELDTIAISADTYQLVQGYFVCQDLGQHTLRGVDEAQHVYQVVEESAAQSRLDVAASRGLTPLVGRESETALLLERWEQAKDGQGQVVLLSGEAGIGKSRLLQVLRDHVAGEPHTRLECRSSPYYQNTALYPITDMFHRLLDWNQDDTSAAKVDKLEQALRAYRLELDEAMPLFASLLSLTIPEDRYPTLTMSPQRQRQKTLETIVVMLLQQDKDHPALFILEDLHWTDPSTLELLDLLIDQIPSAAICVLLTCRPTFQPTWSSRSYLTPLVLNRLSRSQIESMAERVAGGKHLPAEVQQQIVEKTDGVPLFVEEMTKSVLESGVVKDVNGQYELAGALSAVSIPATLQGSLMARLDRLVTAKAVAQYAAVIGRQFSYALLHAVSQLNERTLQEELHRLVDAELLYQRGLPPQSAYTFKHALIQDAAYQSLLKSTRQVYHQQIAHVLEARFPEVVETEPELLAQHYAEAGLTARSIEYWQQAGHRALQRSANQEVVGHLTRGLNLLATLPDTPERTRQELDLQTTLGLALLPVKGFAAPEVAKAYGRARELCGKVEEPLKLFQVLRGLWEFYDLRAEMQTAQELAEQLLDLAQRIQDVTLLLVAHEVLGETLLWLGEFALSYAHAEQGMALYDRQQHRSLAFLYGGYDPGVHCGGFMAHALWYLGYPDQALRKSREGLALAQDSAHPHTRVFALVHAAFLRHLRRERQAARACAEEGLAVSTEQGFVFWVAYATILRGRGLIELGQEEEAIAQIRQGLASYRATGAELECPYFVALLAEALGKMGRIEEGLTVVGETLTEIDTNGLCFHKAELCRIKGELLRARTQKDCMEAEVWFRQALATARQQQAKSLELRAATSLARLWQSQGKRQEPYDLLAPVYGWFTEGFDTADLKEARALLDGLG